MEVIGVPPNGAIFLEPGRRAAKMRPLVSDPEVHKSVYLKDHILACGSPVDTLLVCVLTKRAAEKKAAARYFDMILYIG